MAIIFHQNMRIYGGNAPLRNVFYTAAFGAINGVLGNAFIAAGFTEIINNGPGLRINLAALAQNLDPGLTNFVVIEVGTTALGTREFIGISTDPNFYILTDAGRVLYNPGTRTWVGYNAAYGFIVNNSVPLPAGVALGLDTRGVAYVAGTYNGNPLIVGFMHNMYSLGNKTGAFANLDVMARRMKLAINNVNYNNAPTIFGGDFNLAPRNPTNSSGFPLFARCARGAGGNPINTTVANPYDFWVVSNQNIPDADARVRLQTRVVPGGSDHAGITLHHI